MKKKFTFNQTTIRLFIEVDLINEKKYINKTLIRLYIYIIEIIFNLIVILLDIMNLRGVNNRKLDFN